MRLPAPIRLLLALAFTGACATTTATSTTARRPRRRAVPPAAVAAQTVTASPATPAAAPEVTPAAPAPASPPPGAASYNGMPTGLALIPTAPRAGAQGPRTAAPSIGTPVVRAADVRGDLHARVEPDGSLLRVHCDGVPPSLVPSTQSPYEPARPAIARSFLPVESRVVACRPRTDARGRLPTHGAFSSAGAPVEFTFPGVRLSTEEARCVGEALCAVRMPAFRAPQATIDYEVPVAETTATP